MLATPAEEFAVDRSLTELVLGLIDLLTTISKHPLEDASEMLVQ